MTITAFREFRWPLRVYIEDTDAGGIVYYVNYLKFMERARTELLRSMSFEHYLNSSDDFMFVVADANISYRKPARMDDELLVSAQVVERSRASMTFRQTICRGDELLAEGRIRVACVTRSGLRPRALPERFVSLLEHHYGTATP